MNDQEKLSFKEKYKNNPVAFVEDFCPDIKLHTYQKAMLNAIVAKENFISFFDGRKNQRQWIEKMRLEYMKAMEMDFEVWSSKGIDVYEKGVLVRTIEHKKI